MVNLIKVTNEDLRKMDELKIYSILTGNLENKTTAKDSSENPLLELIPIENTAVHTSTREIYDELMRVYGGGGWRGHNGCLPTEVNGFKKYKEKTCVDAKNGFKYCNGDFYLNNNFNIISTKKFYEKQSPETFKEINDLLEGGK